MPNFSRTLRTVRYLALGLILTAIVSIAAAAVVPNYMQIDLDPSAQ